MILDVAPHRLKAATMRINCLARSLKTATEFRTIDQIRADVAMDLLLGVPAEARGGVVDITVDLETLARLNETLGDLAGYGPVVADIARQVAGEQSGAEWRYAVVDAETGLPVGGGSTRRRPTASQRREVGARDRACVFPGCRFPATQCDLDHRKEWARGGSTVVENLVPLCRHDHAGRHEFGWTHRALGNGDHLWTGRLGVSYTTSGRSP